MFKNKIAKSLKLKITGSLGILVKAKESGYIEKLLPVLMQVQQTNFRIAENIIRLIFGASRRMKYISAQID